MQSFRVPDRTASVKRELLRGPIFSHKVHSRMSRIFLGEATAAETLDESAKDRLPHSVQ